MFVAFKGPDNAALRQLFCEEFLLLELNEEKSSLLELRNRDMKLDPQRHRGTLYSRAALFLGDRWKCNEFELIRSVVPSSTGESLSSSIMTGGETVISLSHLMVVFEENSCIRENKFGFSLEMQVFGKKIGSPISFYCNSAEEQANWIRVGDVDLTLVIFTLFQDVSKELKELQIRENVFKHFPLGKVGQDQWSPDAPQCSICLSRFTAFLHRHHCRRCGVVVCDSCAPKMTNNYVLALGFNRLCVSSFAPIFVLLLFWSLFKANCLNAVGNWNIFHWACEAGSFFGLHKNLSIFISLRGLQASRSADVAKRLLIGLGATLKRYSFNCLGDSKLLDPVITTVSNQRGIPPGSMFVFRLFIDSFVFFLCLHFYIFSNRLSTY